MHPAYLLVKDVKALDSRAFIFIASQPVRPFKDANQSHVPPSRLAKLIAFLRTTNIWARVSNLVIMNVEVKRSRLKSE